MCKILFSADFDVNNRPFMLFVLSALKVNIFRFWVFQMFWFYLHWTDINCRNGLMQNSNLLQFRHFYKPGTEIMVKVYVKYYLRFTRCIEIVQWQSSYKVLEMHCPLKNDIILSIPVTLYLVHKVGSFPSWKHKFWNRCTND